ncbi:YkvA family protein [Algoriphagus machipongonensis]|uniref:DUF1232 domain-containing protein n=1 Tax=Algoriphagus machipongonensis TaxID=388413 RepID=A3I0S9_9BACT|nr:DUF1232 domain-containing protein [Algoriphagus machipongonensis]EAZ80075.1 hypothetical protein ALPR1_15639 [Algoriphagus machipongonensis]
MTSFKSKATNVLDQAKNLYGKQVNALVKQEEKVKELLVQVKEKVVSVGGNSRVKKLIEPLGVFIRMIKAHFNGAHKLSFSTLGLIVLAMVYFIAPIDMIPDFLGFFGFADDLSVVLAVYAKVKDEIDEFLDWERTQQ